MKKTALLGLLITTSLLLSGQISYQDSVKNSTWKTSGFDFYVAGGVYFGNKYNAAYYNGSAENENNIYYVLNNKYWYDEIYQLLVNTYPYITDSVFLVSLPIEDMKYSAGGTVSLGAKYKFNKNWGISLNYTFVRLRATGIFTMDYNGPVTNTQVDRPFVQHLVATERRSLFELSVSYLFHPHPILKPFIEMGVQLNYTDVRNFSAIFEENERYTYSLLDIYNGVNYVPGVQIQEYDVRYGGVGYGFTTSIGLKIAFNKNISIDPIFYLSASSINLTGYKNLGLNYGAYIRLVMSDMIFLKK